MELLNRKYYINQIKPLIGKNIIKAITGVRRCGKSVILSLIIDELKNHGINNENIHLIDFESEKFLKIRDNIDLIEYVYSILENNGDEKSFLLFDEIQNVDGWEKAIRAIYNDLNVDLYITGSNSNLLKNDLASHLTGRFVEIKIYPFSFKEYCQYYSLNNTDINVKDLFEKYIIYGGMPTLLEIPEIAKKTVLKDIFSSISNNDIVLKNNIRNLDLFNRISQYLLENIGKIVSASNINKYLLNEGRKTKTDTIYNYIAYGENAGLFHPVKIEEFLKGKKILKSDVKIYLADHGFRGVYFDNKNDTGQILENIVYIEMLRRGYNISIGKIHGYEIDFICKKEGQIIYIQVAKNILDSEKTKKREFGQLLKINDNYPKFVLSMDENPEGCRGIPHYNIIDFLLNYELI